MYVTVFSVHHMGLIHDMFALFEYKRGYLSIYSQMESDYSAV